MTNQTTVQKQAAVRFGSGKIEVGATTASLVDVGAVKNASFTREFEKVEVMSDNAHRVLVGIKDDAAYIEFDMMETDFTNLTAIMGGLDTLTNVAASPVTVTTEAHTLSGTIAQRLSHKDGDGTEVSAIVVTDSSSNACTRDTDYVITVDSAGYTCIARSSDTSGNIADGEAVNVAYSYTPNSSVKVTSGGKTAITDKVVRITNTNESSKKLQITMYKCTIESGWTYDFPADNNFDAAMIHIKMKGTLDSTRTAGDQLFEIIDEQAP